jgi:uncharacterized protein
MGIIDMFKITPKEDRFFKLFNEYAVIIDKSAERFSEFLNNLDDAQARYKEIKEIEHDGDKQVHVILEQLNKTFLTPIDREDIYMIAKQMDDIIDFIEATASRFIMFNIAVATEEAKSISKLIIESTKQIINLMVELKDMKKSKKLAKVIIEINRIEEEGDLAFRRAVRDLFVSDVPVIEVIKWKEIYEYLEKTLNACEDIANTIEGVVMKHA